MSRLDRHPTDRGGAHRHRAGLAAGVAAVLTGMTLFAPFPVSAAPAPASPLLRDVNLSADPTSGLPATDAEITVRGSGYDAGGELWVAVCQDDGTAPSSLAHCLGGAIPSDNATTAWAVITKKGKAPYAGPVAGKWSGGGSFKVSLQIPVAVGQDADCVSNSCSVYTRSADDSDRSQDARIPVRFTFGGSSSGGGAPSTEVIGAAPTTVAPDSVQADQAPVGSDQVIVFSGFTPGEVVDSALYSDPIPLPPVQADPAGTVTISFTVPEDLPTGTHLVQAIGRQSARVGIAQFEVVAAETTATSPTETTATTDATASTAPETVVVAPPPTSSASSAETTPVSTTDAAETTAQSSTEAAGTPLTDDSTGAARLLWLWIVLGALIVIGGAAAIVVMLRRRREEYPGYEDVPPAQPVDEVIPAPSWQSVAESGPEQWQPAYQPGPDTYPPGPVADDAGPATEQWSPLFEAPTTAHDPGPATEQWSPLFAGDATPGSSGGADPSDAAGSAEGPDSPDGADWSDGPDSPDGTDPSGGAGRHRSP